MKEELSQNVIECLASLRKWEGNQLSSSTFRCSNKIPGQAEGVGN